MKLLPIESAPLDGTEVFIYNEKYGCMPLAVWKEAGRNGVKNITYPGWCFNWGIIVGQSWGFVGTPLDIRTGLMPTHWLPIPTKEDFEPAYRKMTKEDLDEFYSFTDEERARDWDITV